MSQADVENLRQRLEKIQKDRDKTEKKEEQSQKQETEKTEADTDDPDARSVFVKAVDFSATEQDIRKFFDCCGTIKRVTLLTDHHTRRFKGHVYIEFDSPLCVPLAQQLDEHLFKGRQIKVLPKRKNIPNFSPRRRRRSFR